MTELQQRLDRTGDDLQQLAAQIIEHETWAAQREHTGLQAQQALMGFVQTIRKVGKGTGKRVPELLRQARQLLASARRAVPVWIMPLNRVYESFDPRETKFDVVIIDEASQSDVTALAALYLGREHVVVGDKEQVTPDAVGQRVDEVQRLISSDLQGIPTDLPSLGRQKNPCNIRKLFKKSRVAARDLSAYILAGFWTPLLGGRTSSALKMAACFWSGLGKLRNV